MGQRGTCSSRPSSLQEQGERTPDEEEGYTPKEAVGRMIRVLGDTSQPLAWGESCSSSPGLAVWEMVHACKPTSPERDSLLSSSVLSS